MPDNDANQLSLTASGGAAMATAPFPVHATPDVSGAALGGTTSDLPPIVAPVAAPGEAADAYNKPGRRRKLFFWVGGTVSAVLLAGGIGSAAYASHFSSIALPGTTVSGSEVTGMSRDQIIKLVNSRAENVTITITGDVNGSAKLADLGTSIDAEATADSVLQANSSVMNRFKALFKQTAVPVVASSDPDKATTYANGLIPADAVVAKNASVALAEDGLSFKTIPGSAGKTLDASGLAEAAKQAGTTLTSSEVSMTFTMKDPDITDADATAAANEANARIKQDITITSADGERSFTADEATKASWLKVKPGDDGKLTVTVDNTAITTWVDAQAEEANTEPITGKRNVNANGQVVSVSQEAIDGETVSNGEDLAKGIGEALGGNKAYSGAFVMKQEKAEWKERTIAPGAENLAYQAAPGEKWVDVNLSNKTVAAYSGATLVRGPESMVDGEDKTPTVTGIYNVYLKYKTQTMKGLNADGTPYETKDVPWVTYWTGSYALHGAPWRNSFGYSGSHGCVNLPVPTAKWYYDWTEMGTVVVSHW
ncbi:L,D-transpeptidase family protein [Actinomyces trachealis]|uniref:L,D-transpeptidase family protein n=1 Tax=Actinomyces trachealis TaxID=2763540 RepID=UPI001FD5051E|nr:L,D-transpeptidase family protein [Actinomyces trachealis]